MREPRALLGILWLISFSLLASSCITEYDFNRQQPERGTLGQELHAIWRKDTARAPEQAEKKTQLLDERQAEFVLAVDTIAPASELASINVFLQQALTMVDEGTLPGLTRKVELALKDAAKTPELMQALSSTERPAVSEFVSPLASPDFLGYVTAYPKLAELNVKGAQLVLDNDGVDLKGQRMSEEPNGISELFRTLVRLLRDVEPAVLEDSVAIIVRDMLLREDDRFEPEDATRPLYVARYDKRGLPKANLPTPEAQTPFMDADGDGLADIDERGDFMLTISEAKRPKAFDLNGGQELFNRDAFGRAVIGERFAFDYVDLNKTGLGFLVREFFTLSQKNVMTDMLGAIRAVMGDMTIQEDEQGPYQGFGSEHPLAEMAYAMTASMAISSLPELMDATATFMNEGSSELAGVLVTLEEAVEIADKHPQAELKDNQTIAYDLSPVLHKISSNPALWSAFMDALADPMTAKTGDAMSTLISYKNTRATVELGGRYDACFQGCSGAHALGTEARFTCVRACPSEEIFKAPMDFSAPESEENRSQLQALWHLMWSLKGVPYKMETTEVRFNNRPQPAPPTLIELPGGAEAYLRSVAGNLDLADHVPPTLFSGNELGPVLRAFGIDSNNIAGLISLLSQFFGVKLDPKPKPDQITRLFAKSDIAFRSDDGSLVLDVSEPIDADGYNLAEHMADGLFEAEASGLIDAVYPLVKAFSDNDSESLLLELFGVIHAHYPNDPSIYKTKSGGISPSNGANLRSFEPIIKEVLDQGRLLGALGEMSRRLKIIKRDRKVDLNEELRKLVNHATAPGFKARDGQDYLQLPNGRTLRDVSRLHILVRSIEQLAKNIEADPEAEQKFSDAVGHMLDLVLGAQWPDGESPRFTKQGSVALAVSAMSFMADRARTKRDRGELVSWVSQDLNTLLQDLWTSRLFAGLVLVAEQVLKDESNRVVLDEFMAYLLGAPRGREHATVLAYQTVLRSTNVEVWVPLARFLSTILDPDRVWETGDDTARMPLLSHGALALKRTTELDPEGVGLKLINRGLTQRDGQSPFGQLVDIIADYYRADPTADGAYSAEDYRLFFERFGAWLRDDVHGMEQLYDLVELRK